MSKRETLLSTVVLSALAVSGDNKAPDWVQLTPVSSGTFKSVDGRTFVLKDAAAVIRQSLARGLIPIDANHATDTAAKSGMPAPAAAWIDKIALHGPGNEPGLWGHVEHWTPSGERAVGGREYRFLSPVLMAAKADGEVLAIPRAALTNDPALVMTGLFHNQETTNVDLTELCSLLGLPADSSIDQVRSALAQLKTNNAAMCAREVLLLGAAGLTAKALDDTTTTALCAKLKAPAATGDAAKLLSQVDELQKEVATLSAQAKGRTATSEVETAIAAGKLAPAQKDWAIDYCSREPEGFKKFVGAAPVIVSADRLTPEQAATGALTPTEKALCATLGITEDAFKASKAESAAQLATLRR